MRETIKRILIFIGIGILTMLNRKFGIIEIPSMNDMVEYQFNMFTVSTIFAGFSFTTLGILLGMSSEKLMKKLEGTSIVENNCTIIMSSIQCFCISGFISLAFIIKLDQIISRVIENENTVSGVLYIAGVLYLMVGLACFWVSVMRVFKLISKVYNFNVSEIEKRKERFTEAMKNARKRRDSVMNKESDESNKE